MPDIVLNILSIAGIVLLIIVCVVLALMLLVLFAPITYRIRGKKQEVFSVSIKLNWLFGMIRAGYSYPQPGKAVVKLLCFTLYDSASEPRKETAAAKDSADETTDSAEELNVLTETSALTKVQGEEQAEEASSKAAEKISEDSFEKKGFWRGIAAKCEKIKYTIQKIYDKIKHIMDNISFYHELFCEEETQALLKHGLNRLQKILRNIRPKRLRAEILFGAASPDITGYAMAIYGILSPEFGKHVKVTPDFTREVFLGNFDARGHITIFQIVFHSLMLLFDKRLKRLNAKLKNHRNKQQTCA